MRRLTFMRYNHKVREGLYTVRAKGFTFEPAPGWHFIRQPMQRTEYYMSWGVVTVDELHRMEDKRKLTHYADYVAREDWDAEYGR